MHKLKFWSTLLFAFYGSGIYAQEYPAALIPDSLKTNAHYIIRENAQEIELKSVNSGVQRVRRVLTILDKVGESMAYLVIPYDKNSTVNIRQITLFDVNGKKTKSIKQSEITDSPAYSSSELFSESRIKYYKPNSPVYPYTVLYEFEIDSKNMLSFGTWRPFNAYNVSTQHSSLSFSHPSKVKINRKEVNVQMKRSELQSNTVTETWELNNIKALEPEPYGISLSERVPCLYLMPSALVYDNYVGNADNWSEYGKWMYSLYNGRNDISETEKSRLESLMKEIPDTLGRIRTLYKYLQSNTRYVAITLGLGGFQPFDAKTVFETGYGDCKALTNYMFALLKSYGIRSYPALVSSGRYIEKIFTDFPNFQQFDHVILCVPYARDTIWLECTSQKMPFGFLGDFTDDREVLLITENGGKFAHTRKYDIKENVRSCRSEFKIDSAGTAVCVLRTVCRGLRYDDLSGLLSSNYDEQKKWLYSNSSFPSMQIGSFSVSEITGEKPAAKITESETSKNYCSFSGNYMVLPLNLLNARKPIQKMLKKRTSDIIISRSYTDYDTLVYSIPKNYKYESVPSGTTLASTFGNYSWSVSATEKEIVYIRKFSILQGRYPSSSYKELYDFILSVSKADNAKIILTGKS
jgi:hypothetical protein